MLLGFGDYEVWQIGQVQRGLDLAAKKVHPLGRDGGLLKLFEGERGVALANNLKILPFRLGQEALEVGHLRRRQRQGIRIGLGPFAAQLLQKSL